MAEAVAECKTERSGKAYQIFKGSAGPQISRHVGLILEIPIRSAVNWRDPPLTFTFGYAWEGEDVVT